MNAPIASPNALPLYVLNPSKVKDSLTVLRQLKVHQTLAGYLCVQRTAAQHGTVKELRPQFKEFFREFLAPSDAPDSRPYINPFVATDARIWINANVAGSYSPRSLRDASPLRQVLTISDRLYTLNPEHWMQAREHLTFGRQIPALALAIFLLRDRGITSETPTVAGIIRAFQQEFGYLDEAGKPNEAYKFLYADYGPEGSTDPLDWFTPFIKA